MVTVLPAWNGMSTRWTHWSHRPPLSHSLAFGLRQEDHDSDSDPSWGSWWQKLQGPCNKLLRSVCTRSGFTWKVQFEGDIWFLNIFEAFLSFLQNARRSECWRKEAVTTGHRSYMCLLGDKLSWTMSGCLSCPCAFPSQAPVNAWIAYPHLARQCQN